MMDARFLALRAARQSWVPRPPPGPVDARLAAELVERLRGAPLRVAQLVAGLDASTQRHRVASDQWSLRQHVGHLADLEPLWVLRTRELLDGAAQLAPANVQNPRTWEADFHARPVTELLALFRARRVAWTSWLAAQSVDDFARSAHHARLDAPFSLAQLCRFVADHDDDHITEIRALAMRAPKGLSVRPLTAAEWPRFATLNRAWIEEFWCLEAADEAYFDAGLPSDAGGPRGPLFLAAERASEVVGVISLLPVTGNALQEWPPLAPSDPRGIDTWELAKLAVEPSARRAGVARSLVEAVLGEAQARAARRVVLHSAALLAPAIALYRDFGFEIHSTGPGSGPNARCDLSMTLDLGVWP